MRRVRRPSFTKLGEDIGRSWLHKKFVSEFGYLAAFSNAGVSKLSDSRVMLKSTPHFALFHPMLKLGEWWARSLYQLLTLYLRPNLQNTFDGH